MDISAIITFTLAFSAAVAIPGPGILGTIATTLIHGRKSGFLFTLGIVMADQVYLALVVFALGFILSLNPNILSFMQLIGCCYLLYLALKLWFQPLEINLEDDLQPQTGQSSFIMGLVVTLSNPKTMGFYGALLPGILPLDTLYFWDYLILVVLDASLIIMIMLIYIYSVNFLRLGIDKRESLAENSGQLPSFLPKFASLILLFVALFLAAQVIRTFMPVF